MNVYEINLAVNESNKQKVEFSETIHEDKIYLEATHGQPTDTANEDKFSCWDDIVKWIKVQNFTEVEAKKVLFIDDLDILSLLAPSEREPLGLIYQIRSMFSKNKVSAAWRCQL